MGMNEAGKRAHGQQAREKEKPERESRNSRHYPMPARQRAKQFMPFAGVTGLEPALRMKESEMGYDDTDDKASGRKR